MDEPLSHVGLNKNACVKNAFGATFCGDDAKSVCQQIGGQGWQDAGLDTTGSLNDATKPEPADDAGSSETPPLIDGNGGTLRHPRTVTTPSDSDDTGPPLPGAPAQNDETP